MAQYGKVFKKLWRSQRFTSMSEDGQRILLYCFTGPDTNSAGIFVLKLRHLAIDWKWSDKRLRKAFDEPLANCWLFYDEVAELVYVPSWFSGGPAHHSIQNDNQCKKILSDISENPRSELHQRVIDELSAGVSGIPDRYLERLEERLQQRLPEQSRNIVTVSSSSTVTETIPTATATMESSPKPDAVSPELKQSPLESFNAWLSKNQAVVFEMVATIKNDPGYGEESYGSPTDNWAREQIRKIRLWIISNTDNGKSRKKDWKRFIGGWLNKAVDEKPDKTWRPYEGYMTAAEEQRYYKDKINDRLLEG